MAEPNELVSITVGGSTHTRTAAEWLALARADLRERARPQRHKLCGNCMTPGICVEDGCGMLDSADGVEGRCARVGAPCECAPEARTGCVSWVSYGVPEPKTTDGGTHG